MCVCVQECHPGSLVHRVITAALTDPVPAPRRKASRRPRTTGFHSSLYLQNRIGQLASNNNKWRGGCVWQRQVG